MIDQYLGCPFVYFAERVLGLKEDPEDEDTLDPRLQGTLVHAVLESFFRAWQERGRGAITPEGLADARALFAEIVETHLAKLSPAEAAIQRTRLLGSPVAEGVGDIVFAAEAARDGGAAIVERLLEHTLDGTIALGAGDAARTVRLAAKADRIDLFDDGTFQVIDYKLSRAPDLKRVVQLPAYAAAARQALDGKHGRSWRASGAAYVTFGKGEHVLPLVAKADRLDAALAEGEARLLGAVGRIEQGAFPPSPADTRKCRTCPFAGVCRKDYVDVE
jgi:RecB family exonuclease